MHTCSWSLTFCFQLSFSHASSAHTLVSPCASTVVPTTSLPNIATPASYQSSDTLSYLPPPIHRHSVLSLSARIYCLLLLTIFAIFFFLACSHSSHPCSFVATANFQDWGCISNWWTAIAFACHSFFHCQFVATAFDWKRKKKNRIQIIWIWIPKFLIFQIQGTYIRNSELAVSWGVRIIKAWVHSPTSGLALTMWVEYFCLFRF